MKLRSWVSSPMCPRSAVSRALCCPRSSWTGFAIAVYKLPSQRLIITSGHGTQRRAWMGSGTCACSCMRRQTTAGEPPSLLPLCSHSAHLYFEMHMCAVTQHVLILSHLVSGSVGCSRKRVLFLQGSCSRAAWITSGRLAADTVWFGL